MSGDDMSKLLILGAGGHGKVVAEIAELMNKWNEIAFLDDNKDLKEVNGIPVIGQLNECKKMIGYYDSAFVAVGDNILRLMLINKLQEIGYKVPVLRHPFTSVSKNTVIYEGTVIIAGTVINTNTKIGKGCIINTSSSVDHDCELEDGVHISPGVHIGGTTNIGEYTWVCIGSSISNNINIGTNNIIAAGSAVTRDIENYKLVGGIPARVIKDLK